MEVGELVISAVQCLKSVVMRHWQKRAEEDDGEEAKEENEQFILSGDDKQVARTQLPDMLLLSKIPIRYTLASFCSLYPTSTNILESRMITHGHKK